MIAKVSSLKQVFEDAAETEVNGVVTMETVNMVTMGGRRGLSCLFLLLVSRANIKAWKDMK